MRRASSFELPPKRPHHLPRVSSGPVALLAADDPAAGFAAARGLHASGYEVRPVRLGAKATGDLRRGRALSRQPAELVVIDASRHQPLAMGFLDALRHEDASVPTIVIVGPGADVRDEAARLGADLVLDSPLDIGRLRSAAESLVPVFREFDGDEARGYSFH